MSSTTSRRTILAAVGALAAGSAANLAAVVVTKAAHVDPIFAAIENYRGLWAAFEKIIREEDRLNGNQYHGIPAKPGHAEAKAERSRLWGALQDAQYELADAPATTLAGAAALLRFVAEVEREDDVDHFVNLLEEGEEDREVRWQHFFHVGLAEALERIGAGA